MTDKLRTHLPSIGRFDLFEHVRTDEVTVWDGSRLVACVFPAVVAKPDGYWYVRRTGEDARRFPTKQAALDYVTGQATETEETA